MGAVCVNRGIDIFRDVVGDYAQQGWFGLYFLTLFSTVHP